jgi:hypothetical protein
VTFSPDPQRRFGLGDVQPSFFLTPARSTGLIWGAGPAFQFPTRSLAGRRTVLVASHVLTEIERVASRVMILLHGRLLTTDAMRETGHARQIRLRVGGPGPAILAALRQIPGVIDAALTDAANRNSPALSFAVVLTSSRSTS